MDVEEFRVFAKAAVDYIADYYTNLRDRPVLPDVQPGYIREMLSSEAPEKGGSWEDIFKEMNRVVMPGLTHWQSPNFYAYYPASYSFPSVVGDFMSSGLGVVGINWITGPAVTELEVVMMDWLGKMLDLPEEFLNCSDGPGGGVIKGTASEATLVCLLAAKERTVRRIQKLHPELTESEIKGRLRGYSSDQSNSSIEKAGLMGSMTFHLLKSDEEGRLDPESLKTAIENDLTEGNFPCYVVATLGTTGTCAFDDLTQLGPICNDHHVWLHIDAAYAGSVFVLPEYRHFKNGLEHADSFNFNPHKFMLINFDCSILWVKNSEHLMNAFTVDRAYLKHGFEDTAPEYLHWQIPLGRRFRALKIWFMLHTYGVEGVQKYLRRQIAMAQYFAKLVGNDSHFEVCCENVALVCFRVRGANYLTEKLLEKLRERKKIYVIGYTYKKQKVVRISINSNETNENDLEFAFAEIKKETEMILAEHKENTINEEFSELSVKETRFDIHVENFKVGSRDII